MILSKAKALPEPDRNGTPIAKTHRKLGAIRTRRIPKVWLHVAMSVLVMKASAVTRAKVKSGLRRCITGLGFSAKANGA